MKNLTDGDQIVLNKLIQWDKLSKAKEETIYKLLLIIGGIFIVVSTYNTISHADNTLTLFVTVPGIITGILFLWFYRAGVSRIKERAKLAKIIEKLMMSES